MAAQDSDGEEDFVTYGRPLEPYEEGEQPKKPTPLQEQMVKDEKGRYKRFHGAFTGGFSAGYFNTVGSKEGWTPSTFVSSRQGRSEHQASRPEDFMDEEDLGEFGIAPKEILTTDDFASKTKDKIQEKARELAAVTAPIPGATILEDLIAPAKITVGVQLLRQMGWKEGQGVGPRTKRKVRKQEPEAGRKVYGCPLPPTGSEGSEDEEDEYLPENVTFAPKDVTPIDFTVKDDVHGLGYRGLDPRQALFGSLDVNLFGDGSDRMLSSLGDVRHSKGRKVGISGQAFGVGALEDEDDDIYGTDSLSKYDTVLRDEETGDGLFGWTAPKEYKHKKGSSKELQYIGRVLEGFSIASQPSPLKKIYPAPELPRDYKPVHYFRPVLNTLKTGTLQALLAASQNTPAEPKEDQLPSRHQLSSSQRRDMLGEEALQGPTSVMDLLSEKDRERIKDVKQTIGEQRLKAQKLAQEAIKSRFQAASEDEARNKQQDELLDRRLLPPNAGEFRPFEKNPEKQKRYEIYIRNLHEGKKDALESCLDSNMTEWERSREREEFMRSAMLYKPTNSSLSSRFTRGKHEDDSDSVEVPRDQEGDMNDKSAAVKMKMFGRMTREQFEWHPDKLLCKRFNIPDPYPGSTFTGLPKVKRDKYSVFNFLTIPEPQPAPSRAAITERPPETSDSKQKKSSRWDVSSADKKKDPLSEFLSQARSQSEVKEEQEESKEESVPPAAPTTALGQRPADEDAEEEEEKRPPIDLFKAIFADSSDEKSSSSGEESDEETSALPGKETQSMRPEKAPPPAALAIAPEVIPPITPVPPAVTDETDRMNTEEEFGPRLPPAQPPVTLQSHREDLSKKQRRRKDKHKAKKEHKHKKEKKKKHKKQKHKTKHKKKKESGSSGSSSSTDSEDSSAEACDPEEAAKITPRELLKRLKHLPIPH